MPRERVIRSQEEETIYQRNRRLRIAENQRLRRQAICNAANDNRRENTPEVTTLPVIQQDSLGEINILCKHYAKHFTGENF